MSNSPIALARAAAFAALLVAPTGLAFAADSSVSQQTAAPPARQQAQALGTAAVAATNGNDPRGDDPYLTARRNEKFRTGVATPKSFSNEPNWRGPEYTGQ